MADDAAFRAFVETNGAALLHAARLLTGDHHRGEDLVQTALTRVYLKWDRIDTPLAYARKALVTAHIDSTRRRWWGERPTETLPEAPRHRRRCRPADERDELRRLLAGPEPQGAGGDRAALLLRPVRTGHRRHASAFRSGR